MSDGDLAARLRATVDTERIATHSSECWRWHRDCALLMACDEIDRLREDVAGWMASYDDANSALIALSGEDR